jgi:predicted RNase H-like nuclease
VIFEAPTFAEAISTCRKLGRPGISQQAWALRSRIFDVEAVATHDLRVYEVHPEVSFWALNAKQLLTGNKRSWNGIGERISLLASQSILIPDALGAAGLVPADDVSDAAVAAWTASRIVQGIATRLPAIDQVGDISRAPAIWY